MKKWISLTLMLGLVISLVACRNTRSAETIDPAAYELDTIYEDDAFETDEYDEVGTCGEKISWGYKKVTGELVVYGNGKMDQYTKTEPAYWDSLVIRSAKIYGAEDIGAFAFQRSNRLASVIIGNGVTRIGTSAFEHCSNLHTVNIIGSVTVIGDYAFYDCGGLSSITIPDSVTNIGNCAFSACDSLTSIAIPAGVETIGASVFKDCGSLTDIYYGGTEDQWSTLIGSNLTDLAAVTIHYNS